MSRVIAETINSLRQQLDEAEAIILQVMHQSGPIGEQAWAYYQKYMVDNKN